MVSVICVGRGTLPVTATLNGAPVERITPFLVDRGPVSEPIRLSANADRSFKGAMVLGMGFTFDDQNVHKGASPIATMHELIASNTSNEERIFPYIGGAEVNDSPTHTHHRWVIAFGQMPERDARQWPDLLSLVERQVRPERESSKDKGYRERWWQFGRPSPALFAAVRDLGRVLVIPRVTKYCAFAFLPPDMVYSEQLVCLLEESWSFFGCVQGRAHELWARFFSSSHEERLRYSGADCFETFPFPENWQTDPTLEAVGKTYYEFRADLMVRNDEGLTKTYNRFHDPNNYEPDILKLRELHAAIDRAVLDAYGWDDISTDCEFILDYEINEETWGNKKKPYRYRWPEAVHDEVLARLLDLNQRRYQEEVAAGLHDKQRRKKAAPKRAKARPKPEDPQGRLL